jgi:hypothetical protein
MLYRVVIGDWSDDGHGKTETFFYDIPLSDEASLKANYDANCARLNVKPDSWAENYQDWNYPVEDLHRVIRDGFQVWREDTDSFPFDDDNAEFAHQEFADMLVYLATDGIGTYEPVEIPAMFGGGFMDSEHYGYGMFE